jgi:hypothetical protein
MKQNHRWGRAKGVIGVSFGQDWMKDVYINPPYSADVPTGTFEAQLCPECGMCWEIANIGSVESPQVRLTDAGRRLPSQHGCIATHPLREATEKYGVYVDMYRRGL